MDKPEWFYRQSGVIPYRLRQGGVEVLLVTNRRNRRWVIPKGIIEPGLSAVASAQVEAWEEAGLRGVLQPQPVGEYRYAKWSGECTVQVFLLAVTAAADVWPEAGIRRREWLRPEEAAARVREPELAGMLAGLGALLGAAEGKEG